ncbi:hypothetical protein Tco_0760059 [Tanacetum coccineum]
MTVVTPEVQQQSSSVSSGFISNMLNPNPDTGIDSILNPNIESTPLVDVHVTTSAEIPSSIATLPPPPIPLIQDMQQTSFLIPTTVPSSSLENLANFGSLFGFDNRLKTIEHDFLEFKQTNQFADAVSSNSRIVDKYLTSKLNDAVNVAKQVKAQVNEQVTKILSRNEKLVNDQLESEVLTRLSSEPKTSHAIATSLSELELKKILIDKMENNKSIDRSNQQKTLYKALMDAYETDKDILEAYRDTVPFKRHRDEQDDDEEPSAGSNQGYTSIFDRDWNKTVSAAHRPIQPWISTIAQNEDHQESFNKLMDTPLDFSAFMMNRLKVDTLTLELLAGLTFELMKGSCKSLIKLEYFFEEVYKATTYHLYWNNPEGQQYPHDLRKPLPLILNSRGRQVIPFDHFINNDLVYLSGGISSRTYTTSVTKTKAADYGHIKWIEDLVPNTMWIQVPVNYDKLALWGVSYWGKNIKDSMDLRLTGNLLVMSTLDAKSLLLQIVKWHNYKHLDWITVRRDDDKLYKFKKGVKSYQKKLNSTKPDTYRFDLKRREAYTMYSNPKGFIYQNKDKKNKLMRIDELHKFSNGTLNDVRTALNDLMKGIRMEYLPHTI